MKPLLQAALGDILISVDVMLSKSAPGGIIKSSAVAVETNSRSASRNDSNSRWIR